VKTFLAIVGLVAASLVVVNAGQMHGMGRVQGKVIDDSNAAVTEVKVTATPPDGGKPLISTSDDKGEWKIVGMTKGAWDVAFEKAGFATSKAKVILESEDTRLWPITIKLTPAPAR
jgi:hypothetical protein